MDDPHQSSEPLRESGDGSTADNLSPRDAERAALKLLREHVAKAIEEIVRLRAQNKSLARRLAEFESAHGGPASIFDSETDVTELKSRITSFVSSIDAYLAESGEG